jgi:multiple sugar transport system ATP-binding protein
MAAIELSGVTKTYGATTALRDVSLGVKDNEFFCVFGPPTSGKTTILRLILGLEDPDGGDIRIGGRSVLGSSPGDRNVAMVFQNLALFPHMSALDNIRFPLTERRVDPAEAKRRVEAVAEKLHITRLLAKMPAHLSGGERQRVAIARALVRDPNAYLMDDPISALDARLREETRVELKRIQRELGHTLVYVTHDQEEAMSVADRMAILEHGAVVQTGTPDEIYNRPTTRYVAELVGSPRINMVRGTVSGDRFQTEDGRLGFALGAGFGADGGAADLGVRPEDVTLVQAREGVAGEVTRVEALGGYTVVDIATANGLVFRAARRGLPRVAIGEAVGFRIDPARIHLFDAASGRSLKRGSG